MKIVDKTGGGGVGEEWWVQWMIKVGVQELWTCKVCGSGLDEVQWGGGVEVVGGCLVRV